MSNLGQNNKKSSNTPSRSNNAGINKTAASPSVITPSPTNTTLNSSTGPLNSNNMYNLKNNAKNTTKSSANNIYKNNAKITIDELDNICLVATKKIKSSEEIFCGYGKKYWDKHG